MIREAREALEPSHAVAGRLGTPAEPFSHGATPPAGCSWSGQPPGAAAATSGAGGPAFAGPQTSQPTAYRSVVDELSPLVALRDSGALSTAEFETVKAQLLARPVG